MLRDKCMKSQNQFQQKDKQSSSFEQQKPIPTFYCVCATVDTGLIQRVVTYDTAVSNVNLGWVILRDSVTLSEKEAERTLRYWRRSHRKLSRMLDEKTMYYGI